MGAAEVIIGIFLIASLSITWISGNSQRTKLDNAIKNEMEARSICEINLNNAANQTARDNEQIIDLTEKLKEANAEKARIEKELGKHR